MAGDFRGQGTGLSEATTATTSVDAVPNPEASTNRRCGIGTKSDGEQTAEMEQHRRDSRSPTTPAVSGSDRRQQASNVAQSKIPQAYRSCMPT